MSKTVKVFRAYERGELRQIALSKEQLIQLCARCIEPEWSIDSSDCEVGEAQGVVVNWSNHGGQGGDHVHWNCPLCREHHISDFDQVVSNPALWFCERRSCDDMCLVYWKHETEAPEMLRLFGLE